MLYRKDGTTTIWKEPSGRANGMNFDATGCLVVCCDGKDGGAHAVQRYGLDGRVSTLASHYDGKRLNGPNDLCFDRHGRIYFTDPRYGYQDDLEQDCMAVYRIELDGSLTRVISDMETPNGILISDDNRTLYVVDYNQNVGGARTLLAYDVDGDGNCTRRGVLHDFGREPGGDGMVLDVLGNIYLAAGSGDTSAIYIFSPEGELYGRIPVPETAGNCTFGGPDLTMLYIAGETSLYRMQLRVPGRLAYPRR
jgi:gluconolactonase